MLRRNTTNEKGFANSSATLLYYNVRIFSHVLARSYMLLRLLMVKEFLIGKKQKATCQDHMILNTNKKSK